MNNTDLSNFPTQFSRDDCQIESVETAFDGYFKIERYRFRHRLFSGGWSEILTRELFERGHAVAVLPYDPSRDELVLVEQIRVGAFAASCQPWQIEVVAGIIEPGEDLESVAYRETQEEAGLTIQTLHPMMKYLSSSGGSSETIHLYLGIVDLKDAGGIHGLTCEDEDILVHRVKRDEALQWLASGKIENAATIIALQWLALNVKLGTFSLRREPFGE